MSADLDLTRGRIQLAAKLRHAEFKRRDSYAPHFAEPLDVGRVAERLAANYFTACLVPDAAAKRRTAWAAGVLVYAIEHYAMSFDEVCRLADESVASAVAGLSPDNRMPSSRRVVGLCSLVGQADHVTQVVKLAELFVVGTRITDACTQAQFDTHGREFRHWADDARLVLRAMGRVETSSVTSGVVLQVRDKVEAVVKMTAGYLPRASVEARRDRGRLYTGVANDTEEDDS